MHIGGLVVLTALVVGLALVWYPLTGENVFDRVWREQSPQITISKENQTIDFRGVDSKFLHVCLTSFTEGPYGPESMSAGSVRPWSGHIEKMPFELNNDRIIAFFYDDTNHLLQVPIYRNDGLSDRVTLAYKVSSPSKIHRQCARRDAALAECIGIKKGPSLKCLYLFRAAD